MKYTCMKVTSHLKFTHSVEIHPDVLEKNHIHFGTLVTF